MFGHNYPLNTIVENSNNKEYIVKKKKKKLYKNCHIFLDSFKLTPFPSAHSVHSHNFIYFFL